MLLRTTLKKFHLNFLIFNHKFFYAANTPKKPIDSTNLVSPNNEINKVATELSSSLNANIPYLHKFNYNFEENKAYTKKVKTALIASVETANREAKKASALPRRKRRVYDRPLHDLNLEKYSAWRVFDTPTPIFNEYYGNIVAKIIVAPATFLKVFGKGRSKCRMKHALGEYDFEDNDLSRYLVYDHQWEKCRNKTNNEPITEQEFWKSEEPHVFRVQCTRYADFRKFKKWIYQQIEQKKNEPSFDETFLQKYGNIETFDDYDKKYELTDIGATYQKYNWSFYLEKGEKVDENMDYSHVYIPAKVLEEKYRLAQPEDVKSVRIKRSEKAQIKFSQDDDETPVKDEGKSKKEDEKAKKKAKGEKKEKKTDQSQNASEGQKKSGKKVDETTKTIEPEKKQETQEKNKKNEKMRADDKAEKENKKEKANKKAEENKKQ